MRRFRYICGGEEGRSEVGSLGACGGRGVLRAERRSLASWEAGDITWSMLMFGGGAPLTIWSSEDGGLDCVIVVVLKRLYGGVW